MVLGLGYSFVFPFLSLWGTQHIGLSPVQFSLFMTAVMGAASLRGEVDDAVEGMLREQALHRRAVGEIGALKIAAATSAPATISPNTANPAPSPP